jgi:hypothetical protein
MATRPRRVWVRGVGRQGGGCIFWAAGCLPLVLAALVSSASSAAPSRYPSRGEALFVGRERLQGRIRGHDSHLPPDAVRCRNCHAAGTQARDPAAAAPRIDRSWLLELRARRGGPPSSYDRSSFCKLLRTGVDPAYVLIAREMPIYDLDDARCAELWKFVTVK